MQQRVTDEQIDQIIAGETVQFTLEQLLHLFKFMNVGAGLTITKVAPGVFDAFSMRRQPGWNGATPPTKEEMTAEYQRTYPSLPPLLEVPMQHVETGPTPLQIGNSEAEDVRDARYAEEALDDDVEPRGRKQ